MGGKELSFKNKLLMDANKILSADPLDILFEGRNKAYGAYDLRKTYRQRLLRSVLLMLSLLCLLFGINFLLGFIKPSVYKPVYIEDMSLVSVKTEPEKRIVPPPVQPPPRQQVQVNMRQFTSHMIITKDPPEDEKPPKMDDLDNVKIGTVNKTDGRDDDGSIVPTDNGKGIIDQPKKANDDDWKFMPVEIESTYPGGADAWRRFLEQNLYKNLPQAALDEGIEGSVVIRFIVDVDGAVSDVTAMSGPKELQPAAINVIRKSGKWKPAEQNGRKVKSYKSQVITIKLEQN